MALNEGGIPYQPSCRAYRVHTRHVLSSPNCYNPSHSISHDRRCARLLRPFLRRDGKLAVNGQCDTPAVQKLASDLFGAWKSPGPYTRVFNGYQKTEPMKRKIETPDKQNALFIAAMQTKMSDSDPDYAAMQLANYLFGGSLGSRLFKRIREKEGLSYGVNSGFTALTKAEGATFSISAISNPRTAPRWRRGSWMSWRAP